MKNISKFSRYQLPAIIWAIVIFIESSIADLAPPTLEIEYQDKIAHIIVFGILGYLITRAFYYNSTSNIRKFAALLSIIVALLYGISDEIHQYYVPGRYSEFGDVVADFIGILLAQLFFVYRRKFAG